MKVLQQMRYLLYRNFILKLRNKRQTLYELISVIYFVAILAVIRKTAVKPKTEPAITDSDISSFPISSGHFLTRKIVGYVIKEGNSTSVVERFIEGLDQNNSTVFMRISSEEEMERLHKEQPSNISMGFVLNYDATSGSSTFKIRLPFGKVIETSKEKIQGGDLCYNKITRPLITSCPANSYFMSGFVSLQSLLQSTWIGAIANTTDFNNGPSISVKMFPKAEFKTSLSYLQNIISIYLVLAFSPYILFLLTNIVTEKEKKIKESMKIMGLKMYAFWLSWFLTYAVFITVGVIIVMIIAQVAGLFGNSNFFIVFLTLLFYGLSIETLSFMLTPLFNNARTAGMFGSTATVLLSLLSLIHIYLNTSNGVKWLTAFLSPVALSLALVPAVDVNDGLTWSNVATKGDFPAAYGIIMLVVDTLLYLLIAVYLDLIFPGEYGHKEHPLFFLHPSFWKKANNKPEVKRQTSLLRQSSVTSGPLSIDVEDVDDSLSEKKAISIQNMKKVFNPKKKEPVVALNGVSFDVYEGQITALLGHNGAGKSTLIAALTGMLTPTSGTAIVYGLDITKSDEMESVREMIGLCPQQNILIDQLTCREHLTVFAGIKGIPPKNINNMVETVLGEIDLINEADKCSQELSGGQKRKLCVGIAIIGDPKILIFDEPTSGMDPASRRKIWSLLQRKRSGNVILLTTHFMDEADILADYKAIISNGKLRCAGSSLFLKSRFGVGYHLSMVVDPDSNKSKIIDVVQQTISTAQVSRNNGKELSFRLPLAEVDKFSGLFSSLESYNNGEATCSASELGIISYGVSMTTLEEVFLKLEDHQDDNKKTNGTKTGQLAMSEYENGEKETQERVHSSSISLDVGDSMMAPSKQIVTWLGFQQMLALLEIRLWTTLRSAIKIFFQVVVPPGLLFAGLLILRGNKATDVSGIVKPLDLTPDMYVQQGLNPSSKLSQIVMKNVSQLLNFGLLKDGFSEEKLPLDVIDSISNLLAINPHALAYDPLNIDSNGKISYQLRYNDSAVHSMPIGISIMYNIMQRMALKSQGYNTSSNLNANKIISQPFPSSETKFRYDATSFVSVMLIGLSFAVMCSGFAIDVVYWRQFGMRHLTRVSGTSRTVYWLAFLVGDMITYMFPLLITIILVFAFDLKAFNSGPAFLSLLILLLLFIPMSLMFAYTLSFMFSKYETAMNVVGTLISLLAIIPYTAVSNVDMTASDDEQRHLAYVIHVICCVLDPPYVLLGGMYYITRVYTVESIIAQDINVDIPSSKYFSWTRSNGVPPSLLFGFIHLLLFTYFVALLDHWKTGGVAIFPFSLFKNCRFLKSGVRRIVSKGSTRLPNVDNEDDMNEDVRKEREKVMRESLAGDSKVKACLLQGLAKKFGKKNVVNDLYLSVDQGEIFGMLGPNGAGKTTTLNIITADLTKTKGQVFVGGFDISTDLHRAHQSLGYCPQQDALWEAITTREHLKCFALIKGVPRNKVKNVVQHYLDAMKINEHADKRSKDLSGGTKRKLNFCMSMLGNPSVLMFDEPSTGMDPSSKRFLWTAISRNVTERGAILTTHSMEEADALCSRVGILVKGSLKCVGTTQELKSNYGGGYQLEIKAASSDGEESTASKLTDFVTELFPHASLYESFGTRFTFKVPISDVGSLSHIFSQLEQKKTTFGIEEYCFSQSSLEQVFLDFAREQDEDFTGKPEENPTKRTVNS